MKTTKLDYQMMCFIDTLMNFRLSLLEGTAGQLSNADSKCTKILIITSSSCSIFPSVDMFFSHAVRRQNMAILLFCLYIAHVTAICRNPHKSSNLDSPLLDSWVTNATSVKMFSPETELISPFIFVTNYLS